MSIAVCLVGSEGKMGKAISEALAGVPDLELCVKVDMEEDFADARYIEDVNPDEVSVVINFTNPQATLDSAHWCVKHGKPLVIGTTGLDHNQLAILKKCAEEIPILWSPNMSLGVNLIDGLLPKIAEILQGFAIEIVEIHHDQKKDYPSGTALRFAETLARAKGGEIIFGRAKGKSDSRPIIEVVVHAIRGGTVPGEHTIYFLGQDEVIQIKHQALSRKIFALGAVKAAQWLWDADAGFYNMNDVLGL